MKCTFCGKDLNKDDISYGACRQCETPIESEQ